MSGQSAMHRACPNTQDPADLAEAFALGPERQGPLKGDDGTGTAHSTAPLACFVLGGMDREGAYALIRRRKADEERNRDVILPELFRGRPEPLTAAVATPQGNVLRGIAVSPGRVSGRARVILDPRQDAAIVAADGPTAHHQNLHDDCTFARLGEVTVS